MTDATREAQRDVAEARADVSNTLDELKQKLSTADLFGELKDNLWPEGGSEALSNAASKLSKQVQENPLPLLLVGAGVAWMMFGRSSNGGGRSTTYGRNANEMAGQAAEGARHAYASARDAIAGGAEDLTSSASHAAHVGAEQASEAMSQVAATTSDAMENYPLAVGAAVIALGAIIGSALPATEVEDEQLGSAGDRLRDAAAESGQEALAKAGDIATKAGEVAANEAQSQGVLPSGNSERKTDGMNSRS